MHFMGEVAILDGLENGEEAMQRVALHRVRPVRRVPRLANPNELFAPMSRGLRDMGLGGVVRPLGQRERVMTEIMQADAQLDILLRGMASVEISAVLTELDGEIEMMVTPTNFDVILLVSLFMDIFCTSQPLEATDAARAAESVVQEPSEVAGSVYRAQQGC